MASLSFGRHKVSVSKNAIVARSDVPRSTFKNRFTHKTVFAADRLVPVYCKEIIPGDTLSLDVTAFVRTATPLFPIMDNLYCDFFFFFVPNRLVWDNWVKFMGERTDPDDSIDFLVPQGVIGEPKVEVGSVWDHFGIITADQYTSDYLPVNALPLRSYYLIYNEWFRDENLEDSYPLVKGDGPDIYGGDWRPLRRHKRHDYFTSSLPWPQKGNAVSIPLLGSAPVVPAGDGIPTFLSGSTTAQLITVNGDVFQPGMDNGSLSWVNPKLEADLTDVLAVSVNTMRAAIATQQLLEKDARGGTRYTELLRMHFGVDPQDARLQRPEYLGGSSTPINFTPVAQTVPVDNPSSPLGALGAAGTAVPRVKINHSFPEHGHIIGLVNVRADLTYFQGLEKMWWRKTRYDYPWPVFAHLGEQPVLQGEIFATGQPADTETVFGYQERYAEYRFANSMVTSLFRPTVAGSLGAWHLAQVFATAPTLDVNGHFIRSNTPMDRVLAAGELAEDQAFISDILFDQKFTRPLPVRGTPGLLRL